MRVSSGACRGQRHWIPWSRSYRELGTAPDGFGNLNLALTCRAIAPAPLLFSTSSTGESWEHVLFPASVKPEKQSPCGTVDYLPGGLCHSSEMARHSDLEVTLQPSTRGKQSGMLAKGWGASLTVNTKVENVIWKVQQEWRIKFLTVSERTPGALNKTMSRLGSEKAAHMLLWASTALSLQRGAEISLEGSDHGVPNGFCLVLLELWRLIILLGIS